MGYSGLMNNYEFKKSIYNIISEVRDGYLIFNTASCKLMYVTSEELDNFWNSNVPLENGYLVKINDDEKGKIIEYRECHNILERLSKYVIFTTTDCNARCYYCFEKNHTNRKKMETSTCDKVVRFIDSNYDGKKIQLAWFGGEPLLNTDAIHRIISGCEHNNIDFYSTMITNGILFSNVSQDDLKRWKLKWVQIPLDGQEEIYNKIKNYIDRDMKTNPFKQVIDNIQYLAGMKIHVLISLRVNLVNGESLYNLLDLLYSLFHNNKYVSVMCATIHEKNLGEFFPRNEADERYVRYWQKIIMMKAYELGLYRPHLPKNIRVFHCNSDNGSEIIIYQDGQLGWCNNYLDDGFIGDVNNGVTNDKEIEKFKKRYEDNLECDSCAFYPQCTRLVCCDGSTPKCTTHSLENLKLNYEIAMKNEYIEYVKTKKQDVIYNNEQK